MDTYKAFMDWREANRDASIGDAFEAGVRMGRRHELSRTHSAILDGASRNDVSRYVETTLAALDPKQETLL